MFKRVFAFLLALVLLLGAIPVQYADAAVKAQASNTDIRVMSANLQAEFASWTSNNVAPAATSTRVLKLKELMNRYAPTVIGAQEVSPSWYTAFNSLDTSKWGWLTESDAAGYSYYNFVPNRGLALNTILYRKDLLTLKEHGVIAYDTRSNGQCIVWAVFNVNATNKQFIVLSSHWTPGSDKASERNAQATQLAREVKTLRSKYADTIIATGDFNCKADSTAFSNFVTKSKSADSGLSALTRDDTSAKIDHITATKDATIRYYTVAYEANGSMKISDHPFMVADIQLGGGLLFQFKDDTAARSHYKQGAYRANAFDYHLAYWMHYSGYSTNLAINKTNGTLSFNVTAKGNPFIMPAANKTTDPTLASGLNYNPKKAEVVQIRFRLDGCEAMGSSTWISFFATNTSTAAGEWKSNAKSYNIADATGKYLVLNIPLTTAGVKSLTKMETFRMNFANIKNGKVTIDYIYVGPSALAPN